MKENGINQECGVCKNLFYIPKCKIKKRKHCSIDCYTIAKKGKKLSEETINKMSRVAKEKGFGKWMVGRKGELSTSLGRKHTEESKEKNRLAHLGKKASEATRQKMREKARRGEKNNKWKGGVTPINHKIRNSLEYTLWRIAVFERDDFTCVWCGKIGGELNADHIKPFADYPELRFAIDNGRTLCRSCHLKTETFGWNYWVNNKRK